MFGRAAPDDSDFLFTGLNIKARRFLGLQNRQVRNLRWDRFKRRPEPIRQIEDGGMIVKACNLFPAACDHAVRTLPSLQVTNHEGMDEEPDRRALRLKHRQIADEHQAIAGPLFFHHKNGFACKLLPLPNRYGHHRTPKAANIFEACPITRKAMDQIPFEQLQQSQMPMARSVLAFLDATSVFAGDVLPRRLDRCSISFLGFIQPVQELKGLRQIVPSLRPIRFEAQRVLISLQGLVIPFQTIEHNAKAEPCFFVRLHQRNGMKAGFQRNVVSLRLLGNLAKVQPRVAIARNLLKKILQFAQCFGQLLAMFIDEGEVVARFIVARGNLQRLAIRAFRLVPRIGKAQRIAQIVIRFWPRGRKRGRVTKTGGGFVVRLKPHIDVAKIEMQQRCLGVEPNGAFAIAQGFLILALAAEQNAEQGKPVDVIGLRGQKLTILYFGFLKRAALMRL